MSGDRTPGRIPRGLLRRDRLTGQIAVGLVGVLLVSAVVYGIGVASARYKISDVGAWLTATTKGMIVHANGLVGRVDGKAAIPRQARGHRIKIVQDGGTVLLVDETTGVVSRIDPSQLKVEQSRALGGVGLQVVIGAGAAYTVDPAKGAVQQIDPVKLTPVGPATTLSPPLGPAGVDAKGTLWVPVPQAGQVVPFQNGSQGQPVATGKAGDTLGLSIVAGVPTAVDSTAATATIIGPAGARQVALPQTVTRAARGGVKLPATVEGQTLPMLADRGDLVLLDTGTGSLTSVGLRVPPNHALGQPHILGTKVYIPDQTAGALIVYDHVTGRFDPQIVVSGRPGPLEVFVKDGILWANDPAGDTAISLDASGKAPKRIKKYDDKVPGGARKPIPSQSAGGGGNPGAPRNPGDGDMKPPPRKPRRNQPPGPPSATATGANGKITVTFQPSQHSNIPPTGYALRDGNGFPVPNATPGEVAEGRRPYQFTIDKLACGRLYAYRVVVRYRDPKTKDIKDGAFGLSNKASACEEPAAPVNVAAQDGDGEYRVTFQPGPKTEGVQDYVLTDDGGAPLKNVRPAPSTGPYEFRVTSRAGDPDPCKENIVRVAARYRDGAQLKQATSPTNATARPCTAPQTPTGFQAEGVNHGAKLSWNKAAGRGVTYEVTGTNAPGAPTSDLSTEITGLTNGKSYGYTVRAVNGAGRSPAVDASVNLDPAPHAQNCNGHHNDNQPTNLRSGPGEGYARAGSFPQGFKGSVKVICQSSGTQVTDEDDASRQSSVWDKIEYNGNVVWVSDLYVATPGSNAGNFSVPPLWNCE